MLWILLRTGVQYFEDILKEVFLYNPPVGILHNDSAPIVQSCYYFVCCCHNFVLEHVCHYEAEIIVENLVEYFFSCIPLKHIFFLTSKCILMGKATFLFFLSQGLL